MLTEEVVEETPDTLRRRAELSIKFREELRREEENILSLGRVDCMM
jgi:hypothetical protein